MELGTEPSRDLRSGLIQAPPILDDRAAPNRGCVSVGEDADAYAALNTFLAVAARMQKAP